MSVDLTKLDVARRQLAVAIRLFFDDRDSVSVYTLAANAWEIVDVLCTNGGVDSFSKQTRENISDGKSLKHDYINDPYRNFFKHADNDPEDTLEDFSDDKNDHLLFTVVEDLIRLEQTKLFECVVFQPWYLAVYAEKIAPEVRDKFIQGSHDTFPNIRQLTRSEKKKMGREYLQLASKDKQFLEDNQINISELKRWEGRPS